MEIPATGSRAFSLPPSPPLPFVFWPLGNASDSPLEENSVSSHSIQCLETVSAVVFLRCGHKSSEGLIVFSRAEFLISTRCLPWFLLAFSRLPASSCLGCRLCSHDWAVLYGEKSPRYGWVLRRALTSTRQHTLSQAEASLFPRTSTQETQLPTIHQSYPNTLAAFPNRIFLWFP